jgi:hypothetical protein
MGLAGASTHLTREVVMLHRFWLTSVAAILLLLIAAPAALSSGYVYKNSFGRYGTSLGELRFPMGITADGRGAIYVADSDNARVQKFTTDGVFVGSVGSYGWALGQFQAPFSTLLDSTGRLLVGDGTFRVQVLTSALSPLSSWGTSGTGPSQFSSIIYAMARDLSGNIYVADSERIQKFSSSYGYLTQWVSGLATGIAVDEYDYVYVSNWQEGRISVFDSSGTPLYTIGSPGSAPGQLTTPTALAFAPDGSLIVGEGWGGPGRISRFDRDTGAFIGIVAESGSGDGQVQYPYGLTIDTNGDLFVADAQQNKIIKYAWDDTAPVISHDYDGDWHSLPVRVNFSPKDDVAGGVRFYVSTDGGDSWTEKLNFFVDVAAPADHTNDGTHYIRYKAVDAVGNWTPEKTVRVKIDTRKPRTAVSGVPLGWTRYDVPVSLTASDVGSGVGGVHWRLGTAWWNDLADDGVVAITDEGVHTLEYYAWDNALPQNVEAAKSVVVKIDKTKPSPVASNAITVVRGGTATFRYTLLDNLSPTCTVTLVIKKSTKTVKTVALGAKLSPLQVPPLAYAKKLTISLPVGLYTWTIVAKDLAGNSKTALAKKLTVK